MDDATLPADHRDGVPAPTEPEQDALSTQVMFFRCETVWRFAGEKPHVRLDVDRAAPGMVSSSTATRPTAPTRRRARGRERFIRAQNALRGHHRFVSADDLVMWFRARLVERGIAAEGRRESFGGHGSDWHAVWESHPPACGSQA
jgi:hypothetical protein